jgi:hypothetical protein
MNLDLQSLANTMLDAVRTTASARWPALRALAEVEMRKLAQALIDIHALQQAGHISKARARQLVGMQRTATRGVLCTVKGLGLLTADQAIAAALGVVAGAVNGALKFKLLDVPGKEVKASFKAGKDLDA